MSFITFGPKHKYTAFVENHPPTKRHPTQNLPHDDRFGVIVANLACDISDENSGSVLTNSFLQQVSR